MTQREDEFDGRPELIQMRGRAILLQRIAVAVLVVYIIATLTLLAVNAIQSFQTRSALLDCTQPSGECFKDSQERSGAIIQDLIDALHKEGLDREMVTRQIVIAAAACADDPGNDTVEQIEACVDRTLKEEK